MENYLPYATVIIVVFGFFMQFGLFVRPERLVNDLNLLKDEIDKKYMLKDLCNSRHDVITDMKEQIKQLDIKMDNIESKTNLIAGTISSINQTTEKILKMSSERINIKELQ